jgi:hypothetical protein
MTDRFPFQGPGIPEGIIGHDFWKGLFQEVKTIKGVSVIVFNKNFMIHPAQKPNGQGKLKKDQSHEGYFRPEGFRPVFNDSAPVGPSKNPKATGYYN